jgi:hypothetical protein
MRGMSKRMAFMAEGAFKRCWQVYSVPSGTVQANFCQGGTVLRIFLPGRI